jgi:hypothetical protein
VRVGGCITRRATALFEAGVFVMMLWDDVGGRTWIERAGPRTAVAEAESRPRRRVRRLSRSRWTAAGPRGVSTPEAPR